VSERRASPTRTAWIALCAIAPHPELWWTAVAAAWRLSPQRWWRRWPPLPIPARAYWDFRLLTAFGNEGAASLQTAEVVAYVRWCKRMPGARG
jgi:hypothetical protein